MNYENKYNPDVASDQYVLRPEQVELINSLVKPTLADDIGLKMMEAHRTLASQRDRECPIMERD